MEFRDIGINDSFFNPTLKITVKCQFENGKQALISASGDLIYKGKIIGKLELWKENDLNGSHINFPINAIEIKDRKEDEKIDISLEFKVELKKKVAKLINDERKSEKKGDVLLEADIKIFYFENSTFLIDSKIDLKLSNAPELYLLSTLSGKTQLQLKTASTKIPIIIKASDWINDYAPKLCLGEYEIIEILKFNKNVNPNAKGFEEVIQKIARANTKLLKRENPDDILSDLRSAWDIFDKYHKDYYSEINKLIGADSKVEEKEPSKEQRIEAIQKAVKVYLESTNELKKSIDKLTQIGPHRETYHSTIDDAELAFRLTTSMISYYSIILSKITKESK
ncbi:hypothetical protein [Caldiplasma sukawensis]